MCLITVTDKTTQAPFQLDLGTASLADLARVQDPGRLPKDDKLKYFNRKAKLEKNERVAIVRRHHARLRQIFQALKQRSVGPMDDEVHKTLRSTATLLEGTLRNYLHKARQGDKGFSELALVTELRSPLQALREHLPEAMTDDTLGPEGHRKALERARHEVGDALARGEAGVRAWVKGASISYRGSLATGWRNARKSQGGVAQRINILYPLDEIARGGLPLTASHLDVVCEEGTLKVRMPERHISMSAPVPHKTYDWEPDAEPHTRHHPTEAMLIRAYLETPSGSQLRHIECPQPRGLQDHLDSLLDTLELASTQH